MAQSQLYGAREIENLLRQLPGRVAKNVTANAVRAGARVIAARVRANVRSNPSIDSGLLLRNIGIRHRRKSRRGSVVIAVGVHSRATMVVRKGRKKATKANPAKYIHLVEFGREGVPAEPVFRPAIDDAGNEALAKIVEFFGRGLERETSKLAQGRTSFITGRKIF